ncbi:MAG TPA: MFS transporter [Candidatus Acidoferrum sp.]|nr:MFS transporter [Candidatus Acidoferrum sp.]
MSEAVNAPDAMEARTTLAPGLSRIAILMALSAFLNYVDRGNLSLAAPLIQGDLGLSVYQLGILFSSFFWTYALFQIVSGWLVDWTDVNWVLALGVLLWSAATFGTGFIHGFKLLLVMRLILGVGESVSYPSYSKIIARHFSEFQRGRANSLISAGQACGPAFGTLLGGMLMARIGWRLFFIALGVASSFWLFPWLRSMPRAADRAQTKAVQTPAIFEILEHRSAWGTFAGLFCYNYLSYFLITWLPFYLVHERHFSIPAMSLVTGVAFLATAVSATICGWASDRWIAAGGHVTLVRKTFTGAGPLIASLIVLVSVVEDHRVAAGLLILVCAAMGVCSSNLWAVTQTLAGAETAGKWTGLQNCFGNFAGIIAPALTGLVVQQTGRFFWAFVITGAVSLLGSAAWIFGVGPLKAVPWRMQRA